ncbi:MAG: GNAT family N-acetyltransferase [Spirochaetales bacterium]|nr:GNAT family N-acetyltransferase [Spirochaetales bacterium]
MIKIIYNNSITYINVTHLNLVALLHKREISKGFLSSLNLKFLSKLYQIILHDDDSFLCIAFIDGHVGGVISGTINIRNMYKKAITGKLLLYVIYLIPNIFNRSFFKKAFQTIIYPFTAAKADGFHENTIDAELLSIVVAPEYRNLGIAKTLYSKLVDFFENKEVDRFKIMVGSGLEGSRAFYNSLGAEEVAEISIHSHNDSILFIHNIGK